MVDSPIPIWIVGTFVDEEEKRVVSLEQAKQLAESLGSIQRVLTCRCSLF